MAELFNQSTGRGFNAPMRFEAAVDDCEVVGRIPSDLDGAFYRVGAEWYYPPKFADDAILNADGYISAFRFKGGKVDFKGRWVRTHRLQKEREARRQLYGYYRNPYTDDESVRDPRHPNLRTVSNTAPLIHAGKLFTLKEDGLPHQIDPNSLETIGPWTFNDAWKAETFSAHPKLDPLTGEMVAFGYEATGLASDDLFIYTIDRAGHVRHEVRVKVPYVSIIHDCALTHRHVVIPFGGYVTSAERLSAGKIHWGWDDHKPGYIGVMPREGTAKDMRWFKGPLRCMMHTFNAYSDGNKVILYAPFWESNFFPFFPPCRWQPLGSIQGARVHSQDHTRSRLERGRVERGDPLADAGGRPRQGRSARAHLTVALSVHLVRRCRAALRSRARGTERSGARHQLLRSLRRPDGQGRIVLRRPDPQPAGVHVRSTRDRRGRRLFDRRRLEPR